MMMTVSEKGQCYLTGKLKTQGVISVRNNLADGVTLDRRIKNVKRKMISIIFQMVPFIERAQRKLRGPFENF
jgi:hypothetical protein